MAIRTATLSDARLLAELNAHVHGLHVDAEPEIYRVTRLDEVTAWFENRLREDGVEAYVVDVDGQPVGFALALHHLRPAHAFAHAAAVTVVDQLAIAPKYRRRGLARDLLQHIAAVAKRRGSTRIELDVREHNCDALACYEALGYRVAAWRLTVDV